MNPTACYMNYYFDDGPFCRLYDCNVRLAMLTEFLTNNSIVAQLVDFYQFDRSDYCLSH